MDLSLSLSLSTRQWVPVDMLESTFRGTRITNSVLQRVGNILGTAFAIIVMNADAGGAFVSTVLQQFIATNLAEIRIPTTVQSLTLDSSSS